MNVSEFYELCIENPQEAFSLLRRKNNDVIDLNIHYAKEDTLIDRCRSPVIFNYIPQSGDMLLHHYIKKCDVSVVNELFYFGATANIIDVTGVSALELAISSCNVDIVNIFITRRLLPEANILYRSETRCIIRLACMYNVKKIIWLLMDYYSSSNFFYCLLEKWMGYVVHTLSFHAFEYINEHKKLIERYDGILWEMFRQIYGVLRNSEKKITTHDITPQKLSALYTKASECIKIIVRNTNTVYLGIWLFFDGDTGKAGIIWILYEPQFSSSFKRHILQIYISQLNSDMIMPKISHYKNLVFGMVKNGFYEEFARFIAISKRLIKDITLFNDLLEASHLIADLYMEGVRNRELRFFKLFIISNALTYISKSEEINKAIRHIRNQSTLFDITYISIMT